MKEAPTSFVCEKCSKEAGRDLLAEGAGGAVFREYESMAFGVPLWEVRESYKNDRGDVVRRRDDGTEKILCPKEHRLNPQTGNIQVRSSQERSEILRKTGAEPNR